LTQFVVGAVAEARARGLAVLISSLPPSSRDGPSSVRTLLERRVDGIISAAPRLEDDRDVAQLLHGRVPAVSLHHVRGGGVPLVGSDNRRVGGLATEHLLRLGHRRIGTITGPPDRHVVSSRLHGYRAALESAEVAFDPSLQEPADWTPDGGFWATRRLLARTPDVTALVAQNDFMALGSISALHQLGRRVPEDVAVVGCDDLPFVAHTIPPLTTVRLPFQESGQCAVRLLLDRLTSPNAMVPERVLLPVSLMVRASCGAGSTWMQQTAISNTGGL
jgi:LacI family transcriptional regulator